MTQSSTETGYNGGRGEGRKGRKRKGGDKEGKEGKKKEGREERKSDFHLIFLKS